MMPEGYTATWLIIITRICFLFCSSLPAHFQIPSFQTQAFKEEFFSMQVNYFVFYTTYFRSGLRNSNCFPHLNCLQANTNMHLLINLHFPYRYLKTKNVRAWFKIMRWREKEGFHIFYWN